MGLICTPYGYSGAGKVSGISYQGTILGDKPVAYWSLSETSGTVAHDLSGNGFNMAYQNAPTLGASAIAPGLSKSVVLNGTNQFVELVSPPSALLLVSGSFEIWCNQPTISDSTPIFCTSDGNGTVNFALTQGNVSTSSSNILSAGNYDGGWATISSGNPLNPSTPYHLVYINDAGAASLYINGQLAASGTVGSFGPPSENIQIGKDWSNSFYLTGSVSNAAIYNTALTATQILNHYNAGIA